MSAPPEKKASKRYVSCPACKKIQPLTQRCASCGFDVATHAQTVKQKAGQDAQRQSGAKQTNSAVTPPRNKSIKRRDVVCPSCSARQPFTYVCASCGFDIKGHVLRLKLAGKGAPSSIATPPQSPAGMDIPTSAAAPPPASEHSTVPPELHAEAERAILDLFVTEQPDMVAEQEILSLFVAERPDMDAEREILSLFLTEPMEVTEMPHAEEHEPIVPEVPLMQEEPVSGPIVLDTKTSGEIPVETEPQLQEEGPDISRPHETLGESELIAEPNEEVHSGSDETEAPRLPETVVQSTVQDDEALIAKAVDEVFEEHSAARQETDDIEEVSAYFEETETDKEDLIAKAVNDALEAPPPPDTDNVDTGPTPSLTEDAFSELALSRVLDELDDIVEIGPETGLPDTEESLEITPLSQERQEPPAPLEAVTVPRVDETPHPVEDALTDTTEAAASVAQDVTASADVEEKTVLIEGFDESQVSIDEPETVVLSEPEEPGIPVADEDELVPETEEKPALQAAVKEDNPVSAQEEKDDIETSSDKIPSSDPGPEPVTIPEPEEPGIPIADEDELVPETEEAPALQAPLEGDSPVYVQEEKNVIETSPAEIPSPDPEPKPVIIPEPEEPVTPVNDEETHPEEEGKEEEVAVLLAAKSDVDLLPHYEEIQALDTDDTSLPAETPIETLTGSGMTVTPEIAVDDIRTPVEGVEESLPDGAEKEPEEKLPETSTTASPKTTKPKRTFRPTVRLPKPKVRPAPVMVKREPPPPPPPLYPERQTPGPSELLSLGALAHLAWKYYLKRAPLLTALWFVALAGAAVPAGLALGLGLLVSGFSPDVKSTVMTIAAMVGIPAALAGMGPGLGGLVAAISDPTADWKVAFYRGRRLWSSTAIVLFATVGIATGGSVLLIVPGMLAVMGLAPALYVMFIERETGLTAFIKGFEYLKGRTGDSALKFMPIVALCFLTAFMIRTVQPVGVLMLAVFLTAIPYLMIYLHRMFENLRGLKGRIVFFRVSRHVRIRWAAAAVAGAALPLILIVLLWRLGQAGNAFQLLASLI